MAAEIYETTTDSNNIDRTLTNQSKESETTKQEQNLTTNLDSKNFEAHQQLKKLVNDISCGKYTFSSIIPTDMSINEDSRKNLENSQSKNRKRKKNNIVTINNFPAQAGNSTTFKKFSILPTNLTPPETIVNAHRIRKLKLYSIEEKIDIIDYAKIIGNRAAGREFNVAESSIREWRKNEERLRRQIEASTSGTQHFETNNKDLIANIDKVLVEFTNEGKNTVDWYVIREKAQEIWREMIKNLKDKEDRPSENDMNITMGWVARFMRRNEGAVPKLAPPVIATANAMNGHNGSITMVKKEILTNNSSNTITELKNDSKIEKTKQGSVSRRKCLQPVRRMADATLLTTSLHQCSSLSPTNLSHSLKTSQTPSNLTTQNAAIASFLAAVIANNNNNGNLNNITNMSNLFNGNLNCNALAMWLIKNYGDVAKVDS